MKKLICLAFITSFLLSCSTLTDYSGITVVTKDIKTSKKYDSKIIGVFSEGLTEVKLNNKYGFIDKHGNEVIPVKYDKVYSFVRGGLATVELNGKAGVINTKNEVVIPFKYDFIGTPKFFAEKLVRVKKDGKFGFINKEDELVIPFQYEMATDFSECLASVKLNNKWGFIDRKNNVRIPFQYEYAYSFDEGLAKVYLKNGRNYAYINKKGKIITRNRIGFSFLIKELVYRSNLGCDD